MSNERLRAALHAAGLEPEQLADQVEVDVKTVRRWIDGRTPRGRYRTRVAIALDRTEQELWPDQHLHIDGRDEQGEILAAYAHAADLATPDWKPLLRTAISHIDLLDNTLTDLIASPGTTDLLANKARSGCEIRLLLSAPDSIHLTLTDHDLGHTADNHGHTPSQLNANRTLDLADQHLAGTGIEIRTFVLPDPGTLYRFDHEMLIGLHLHATPTDEAPLLHLQRHSDHGLFDRYETHYDAIWNDAQPHHTPTSNNPD